MGFMKELFKIILSNSDEVKRTRSEYDLVSLEELFKTYDGGFVFEYDEIRRYMQEKFGAVASNIFISYNDYGCVIDGVMDMYSIERFCSWLDFKIKSMNVDLSKEKIKLVRNEKDRLIVVKFDDETETTH